MWGWVRYGEVPLHCVTYMWWSPRQTSVLNKHLQDLMEGLTAKVRTYVCECVWFTVSGTLIISGGTVDFICVTSQVFRTFNASNTLQEQLEQLTIGRDCT